VDDPEKRISVPGQAGGAGAKREGDEMTDVANAVMEIIAAKMRKGDHKIALSDRLDALGLDSLDVLEIAFDIEQRLNVDIDFNANTKFEFETVGALVRAIERLVAEKAVST
jgi:acyl carrier protein